MGSDIAELRYLANEQVQHNIVLNEAKKKNETIRYFNPSLCS